MKTPITENMLCYWEVVGTLRGIGGRGGVSEKNVCHGISSRDLETLNKLAGGAWRLLEGIMS